MASELLFWEGRFRDRCLEVPDEALDAYFDGWIQFDPIIYGFQIFEYAGDSEEGIPKNTIKCSQIKPVKNKPKDRYFSFKYTEGTYFEGTTEPIFEMTYQGSRQNALALRECIKEKCLQLPVDDRYPKRNKPEPYRDGSKPDAVIPRHCDICNIWCSGIESWEAHKKGKDHKKNSIKAKCGILVSVKPAPSVFYCDVCDIECTGEEPWQAHVNGGPHKRKVAAAELANFHMAPKFVPKHYCEICNVQATDAEQLQKHLDGKPHKKKAARAIYAVEYQNYSKANSEISNNSDIALKEMEKELDELILNEKPENEENLNEENWDLPENSDNHYNWKVGDICWAAYANDDQWYQATILSIDEENQKCWVSYNGYDEESEVALNDIYSESDWD